MKEWIKPEFKSLIKPIETVFIWNSGQPTERPWENTQPLPMIFLTRIKNIFIKKEVAV